MKLLQATAAQDPVDLTLAGEASQHAPGELSAIAAAGVIHDLGNLIQIAFAAINIVARTPDMPAIHSGPVLARAKASLEQAGAIVRQCISQVRDRVAATSVVECVVDVAALIETMEETGFTLKIDVEPGLPQVDCDPVELRRAVLNLVFNARDAIAGRGVVLIEARTIWHELVATGVELRVADNGIGMSPATIARVFDPYFTTKSDGLGGVGLPMVERFVREARGKISIESELAVGTTVTMRLPAVARSTEPGVTVEMGTTREEPDQ
jgi:signal transduction histidine kinase